MVADEDFTSEWVSQHLPALLENPDALQTMRERAWTYGVRDAAATMAHAIIDLAMNTKEA
jgi:UDP-N-acetylglucosamine--N-acetylmuramyl-(pentapeptide) pyrophosphoryl-undecaprenol N-acetylglucosamine transferase